MYRETIENLAIPVEELTPLVDANAARNMAETVMRIRAVAELSRHASTVTLLGLAGIAARNPVRLAELVAAYAAADD